LALAPTHRNYPRKWFDAYDSWSSFYHTIT
jgi:hypothetical protein